MRIKISLQLHQLNCQSKSAMNLTWFMARRIHIKVGSSIMHKFLSFHLVYCLLVGHWWLCDCDFYYYYYIIWPSFLPFHVSMSPSFDLKGRVSNYSLSTLWAIFVPSTDKMLASLGIFSVETLFTILSSYLINSDIYLIWNSNFDYYYYFFRPAKR